jgi:hypothetical protein
MRSAISRATFVLGMTAVLAAASVAPGGAQETEETTITYAAEADTAGVSIALGGDAFTFAGALTHSELSSDGPAASGFAEAVSGADPTRADSSAPPDEQSDAASSPQSGGVPNVIEGTVGAGNAHSESEAEDGTPSTLNTADVGVVQITAGTEAVIRFDVTISPLSTRSSATATSSTDIRAAASGEGVLLKATLDAGVLSELPDLEELQETFCGGLGTVPQVGESLQEQCNELFDNLEGITGPVVIAEITLGANEVECTWNGRAPGADGSASAARIEVLGEEVVDIAPGEEVVLGEGTPLEFRAGAGTYSEEVNNGGTEEEDTATARATGGFASLFGGQVEFAIGDSTCGVSGLVTSEPIIPRTGGEMLPVLLGGSALAAAGLSLRRYLRAPR